jgi:hypothetical protein
MTNKQSGQSLIETVVAIFVLTTALTTGLGLVIYVFSAGSVSQHEIIATNLAKEGVEVVRMMRDTNWLEADKKGGSFDLQPCADLGGKLCYPEYYKGVGGTGYSDYKLNESDNANKYRLEYNSVNRTWNLVTNNLYNLYMQVDGSFTHVENGNSVYARRIKISHNTASPFTAANPELIIQSIVGWRDKRCTPMTGQDPETTNCKVVIEERLTNWKDYE